MIIIPNWQIHNKWARRVGVDDLIATFVNQNIDYGTSWAYDYDSTPTSKDETIIDKQLKFFYHKDVEKSFSSEFLYVRAYYLHHLLDYFRETRYDIYDLELIFKKFIQEKVKLTHLTENGNKVNFIKEINHVFNVLRHHKKELYDDLKGKYNQNI